MPSVRFCRKCGSDVATVSPGKVECPSCYHSDSPTRVPPTYTAEQRTLMERQCLRCHETIYAEDTYCPYCGTNYAKFRKQMEGKPL